MPETDDPLEGLLRATTRRRPSLDPFARLGGEGGAAESGGGLNPLDLLALPPEQQDLVKWLSRRKQAHLGEIQEALGQDAAQISQVLADLKKAGSVHEALIDGQIYYRMVFRGRVNRAGRGLPAGIWARVDLDNTAFLQQVPLFQRLPDATLRALAEKSEVRHYHRNDVIIWQGDVLPSVFFIKNGVVGVSRLSPRNREARILGYRKQGDMLGEYSLLSHKNRAASATATALSEVDVLMVGEDDFLALLKAHSEVAIELSRTLAHRLGVNTDQFHSAHSESRLCLVFGLAPGVGATTLGSALALTLSHLGGTPAAYTEYPDAQHLPGQFGFARGIEIYNHPAGFDVFVPPEVLGLPPIVQATLVLDRLRGHYTNVVIVTPAHIDETTPYLIERTDQVILLTPPDADSCRQAAAFGEALKAFIHPERTSLCVVANSARPEYGALVPPPPVEYTVPYLESQPSPGQQQPDTLPAPWAQVATTLSHQLGRTNHICIYIPPLGETDPLEKNTYVQETVTFLDNLLGGGTTVHPPRPDGSEDPAAGGSEAMYTVRCHATQAALDRYLPALLEYLERLKGEMKQDALALEINGRPMLI